MSIDIVIVGGAMIVTIISVGHRVRIAISVTSVRGSANMYIKLLVWDDVIDTNIMIVRISVRVVISKTFVRKSGIMSVDFIIVGGVTIETIIIDDEVVLE
jgi:hypothetical protein